MDIKRYLTKEKNITLKKYNKIFKKRRKKSNYEYDDTSLFSLNIYNSIKSSLYSCKVCNFSFQNRAIHDLIMFNNSCPNSSFKGQFLIETVYDIYFEYQTNITADDLDTKVKLNKIKNSYIITNHLIIKCPICLSFKKNCIIQKCGHCLCKNCLNYYISQKMYTKCWICREPKQENIHYM